MRGDSNEPSARCPGTGKLVATSIRGVPGGPLRLRRGRGRSPRETRGGAHPGPLAGPL